MEFGWTVVSSCKLFYWSWTHCWCPKATLQIHSWMLNLYRRPGLIMWQVDNYVFNLSTEHEKQPSEMIKCCMISYLSEKFTLAGNSFCTEPEERNWGNCFQTFHLHLVLRKTEPILNLFKGWHVQCMWQIQKFFLKRDKKFSCTKYL